MRQLIAVVALTVPMVANAAPPDVASAELVPKAQGALSLEATIAGMALPESGAITLRDAHEGPRILATRIVPFEQGAQSLAVAVVIQGDEIFMGGEWETQEYEDYDPDLRGVKATLVRGFDAAGFAKAPPGSLGALITYTIGAHVQVPMGPIANVRGASFDQSYRGRIGTDLVTGVELGLQELERAPAAIKALIVIGDGNDTNNEAARARLADLKKRAAQDAIRTFAIVYKTSVSSEGEVIGTMIRDVKTTNSLDDLLVQLAAIRAQLAARFTVTFPGEQLPRDGRDHDLVISIGATDLEPVTVTMGPPPPEDTPWWGRWRLQLAAGFGLLTLIALAMRIRFVLTR